MDSAIQPIKSASAVTLSIHSKQQTGTRSILIVEDEADIAELIRHHLTKHHYNVIWLDSGKDVVQVAKDQQPELVLLDRMLPGMDGVQVARFLKADPDTAAIPIIFCTILDDTDAIVRGFKVGASDYITKPFDIPELLARIQVHLEIKQQLDKVKASSEQFQHADHTAGLFINIISHELINALTGMASITRLMMNHLDMFDNRRMHQLLGEIHKSSENNLELLRNLLDWSRMKSGKMVCRPTSMDLQVVIAQTLEAINAMAIAKQIQILNHVETYTLVYADPDMVALVLRNLLSNAIKFTPMGGTITIRSHIQGEVMAVSVSDTGVGIPARNLEKLFDIHSRFTTLGTARESGNGLGLILCKDFVEKNGGSLTIQSSLDKGTQVTFTLPVAPQTVEEMSDLDPDGPEMTENESK